MKNLYLYFDGASKGNPGPAGAGFLLTDHDGFKHTGSIPCGKQTNNFAEYTGLVEGLKAFKDRDMPFDLEIRGDSKLVIEQIKGNWNCKSFNLRPLLAEAKALLEDLSWEAKWIPREENSEADRLANEAVT